MTGLPAGAVADVGKTAMIPSGFRRPFVFWTVTEGAAASGVFTSAELIALMSFAPGAVSFVFQIGNLFVEPTRLMTWSGALSTMETAWPGMLFVLRSSM